MTEPTYTPTVFTRLQDLIENSEPEQARNALLDIVWVAYRGETAPLETVAEIIRSRMAC